MSVRGADLEDILSEENGRASRIDEIVIEGEADDAEVKVTFSRGHGVSVDLEAANRGDALALLSDLTAAIQNLPDFRSRRLDRVIRWVLMGAPALLFLAFLGWSDIDSERRSDEWDRRTDERATVRAVLFDRRSELRDQESELLFGTEDSDDQTELERVAAEIENISASLNDGESSAVGVLVDWILLQPRRELMSEITQRIDSKDSLESIRTEIDMTDRELDDLPFAEYPNSPLLLRYSIVWVIVPAELWGLSLLSLQVGPWNTRRSVFLIGREEQEVRKRQALKDRVVWSIIVAFLVGIIASAIAALLLT